MRQAWMSRAWMLPVYVGALGGLPATGALAQASQYETPLYTTQAPAELDKNYGMPNFGMPGAELPQQKTMATDRAASTPDESDDKAASTPDGSDFFAGSTPIQLPKTGASASAGGSAAAGSDMETPLFTTSRGSSTGSTGGSWNDSETTSGYTRSSDGSDNAATR